jgi:diaminopimelate epimerase
MIDFVKGHGTRNDFVLVADLEGALDLTPELVRNLADRRSGVGADGVIRLAPTASMPDGNAIFAADAEWFMDYRNADGTEAEMCGNGVRVTAAFADRLGLVDFSAGDFALATRSGVKNVSREASGWYAVDMGPWSLPGGEDAAARGVDSQVAVTGWREARPALSVDLGNPHTVVALASVEELEALDLTIAPRVHPAPADGTNVELVVPLAEEDGPDGREGHVRMRVHERGVGETESCGTGVCAAALAVRTWAGPGAPSTWIVDVPGGRLRVRALLGGRVELAGPAELVYSGRFDPAREEAGAPPAPAAISSGAPEAP